MFVLELSPKSTSKALMCCLVSVDCLQPLQGMRHASRYMVPVCCSQVDVLTVANSVAGSSLVMNLHACMLLYLLGRQ